MPSTSKNRAVGILFRLKVSSPVRPAGSSGMNHAAHIGMTRGAVEILDGEFFFSAKSSSLGVTT
jgi:hypothetical protein